MLVTRFAPSPTGFLHLGHAHSALTGWLAARSDGGRFLLRIEDIDPQRCRPSFEQAILEDLAWLGLTWDGSVRRQSEHMDDYRAALHRLKALGVVYPCFCSRKEIEAEIQRAGHAPHGADGPLYPGTCRTLPEGERARRISAEEPHAFRLDVARAQTLTGPLTWVDRGAGAQRAAPDRLGDVVIARRDVPTSYHLSVVTDDALQGVTLIIRGVDLFEATHVHRLLQALLDLPVPDYRHHALLTNARGERLSKRDGAVALRVLRAQGRSPAEVRALAGIPEAALARFGVASS